MTISKDERLQKVHDRAIERFDRCYSSQREIRLQCVQDRRFVFVNGAQFEGTLGDQYANRPRFEINKIHQSVIRIFSEYRNNRVTVDFRPEDEETSEETADFLDGLFRADEQESGAQEAYDTAFEEGVAGGMGAFRMVNRYEDEEDEDSDRRRICIEPIPDADNSVFFEIDAKRYDKADSNYCFVITSMQPCAYESATGEDAAYATAEWKKKSITSFDRTSRMTIYDWFSPDVVYVAEYYEIEEIKQPVHFYVSPLSGETEKLKPKDYEDKAQFEAEEALLLAQGFVLDRIKKIKTRKIHKYLIDGNRVLEDQGYIAGKCIPVIPYYAKRLFVDNIERIMGQVRLCTDAQRLYNMLVSLLAEIAIRTPFRKPIFFPEQIQGHEQTWASDDLERYPYGLINPIRNPDGSLAPAGPIGYMEPPVIPPALAGLLQLLGADIQEMLGTGNSQQEVVSNISAKAVELIQTRLDMQSFIYMDNFKATMKRAGEVWLSMAKELYDEENRPMRIVGLDGTDEIQRLRIPSYDEGASVLKNDPSGGKFKVVADVGPSFTTRRDGTVRALTGVMQFVEDPTTRQALTGVILQNVEGEGLQDVKKWNRSRLIQLGIIKPTEEEAKQLAEAAANQKPDPQAVFLEAEANKSNSLAQKAQAETQLTLQKIDESAANIQKTLAQAAEIAQKIDSLGLDNILRLMEAAQGERPATTDEGM